MKGDWEENCEKVFEALHRPILLIDRNHKIVAANDAACSAYCISSEDIVGRYCYEITHGIEKPCWGDGKTRCPVRTVFELRKQTSVIHKHHYTEKVTFEEIVASPVFDDQGKITFAVEEIQDVTELIQAIEISEYYKGEIKILRGILPICTSCKRIRDDRGYWQQVESYIRDRSEADFSHSICPICYEKHFPEWSGKRRR